eukprot:TRINITY_DN2594_c0_g1_i14.p1 TRINITY_DN2594_c0_g1~~TRINITY_DN2594_c0_g1_i14.p1  ORF type:complete len:291 (+),score=57.42 TRINITY_DN2594_c0_g1_i14:662-1534(+)
MPQNPFIIAAKVASVKNGSCDVYIFDYSKHSSKPSENLSRPDCILKGHKEEGNGLSWSPFNKGELLSCSRDKLICHWKIPDTPNSVIHPSIYSSHVDSVEDVAWHQHHEAYFGSVGEDKCLKIWDVRETLHSPVHSVIGHTAGVNCLSFNPFNEWIILTGSSDKTVALWDFRNLTKPLYYFDAKSGDIYSVQWAPFYETVFASCDNNGKLNIWDVGKINTNQTPEERENGPPELIFIHGGHAGVINDLSWNPSEDWTIASVAQDNQLHIWQMAETLYSETNMREMVSDKK